MPLAAVLSAVSEKKEPIQTLRTYRVCRVWRNSSVLSKGHQSPAQPALPPSLVPQLPVSGLMKYMLRVPTPRRSRRSPYSSNEHDLDASEDERPKLTTYGSFMLGLSSTM